MAITFIGHAWREMSPSQAFVSCCILLLGAFLVTKLLSRCLTRSKGTHYLEMPRLGGPMEYQNSLPELVKGAAKKYPKTPYVITPGGFDWVIFPSEAWEEIKRLPETAASLRDYHHTVFHGRWTRFGQESDALLNTIATDIARGSTKKVVERQEDSTRALARFIGRCDDWSEVELYSALFDITTNTTACAFVGRELGDSSKWIEANKSFPITVIISCFIIGVFPDFLKRLVAPFAFLPTMKVHRDTKRMLQPMIKSDRELYEDADDKQDVLSVDPERKLPITAWLLSKSKRQPTIDQLVTDYLMLSLEATSTQSTIGFSTLVELALRPDLVEMLRDEINEVATDGKLPLTNLSELRIMDSVIREVSRLNPLGLFSLHRRLRQPVQLSMGPLLPAGTCIACDSHSTAMSSELWKDPTRFDPLRFLNLRKEPGSDTKYSFASVGNRWSLFGDGHQACPGRVFGASSLKILIAAIIMNYDVKLRPGEGRPKRNVLPNGTFAPDLKAKFLFKSRTGKAW